MTRICLPFLLIVSLFIGCASRAEGGSGQGQAKDEKDEMHEAVDPCLRDGGGLMYCQGANMLDDNRKIDSDLNAAYKTLCKRLHGTPLERSLVISERKWLRDRDKRCRDLSENGVDTDEIRNTAHEESAVAFLGCVQNELLGRLEFIKAALSRLDRDGIEHFHL